MVRPPERAIASCSRQAHSNCPSSRHLALSHPRGLLGFLRSSLRAGWTQDGGETPPFLPRFTTLRFLLALAQAALGFDSYAVLSPFPGSRFRNLRKEASRGHESNLCKNLLLSPSPIKAPTCRLCPLCVTSPPTGPPNLPEEFPQSPSCLALRGEREF